MRHFWHTSLLSAAFVGDLPLFPIVGKDLVLGVEEKVSRCTPWSKFTTR